MIADSMAVSPIPIDVMDFEPELSSFREYLFSCRLSRCQVNVACRSVRMVMSYVIPGDALTSLDQIDSNTAETIVSRIPRIERKERIAVSYFGKFIAYCTGQNPTESIVAPAHLPFMRDGKLLYEFPYLDELDAFSVWLSGKDVTDWEKNAMVASVKTGLRKILNIKGWFDIRTCESELYTDLRATVNNSRFSGLDGRGAGYFCEFLYGSNPYSPLGGEDHWCSRPVPYADDVEQYRKWLIHCEYRSPDSIVKSLITALRRFVRVCGEKPVNKIVPDDLRMFRDSVSREVNGSTLKGYMHSIRRFVMNRTGNDVFDGMKLMFNRPIVRRCFTTKEQYRKALAISDPEERLMLTMCATMGLRRADLSRMMIDDVSDCEVTVESRRGGPVSYDAVRMTEPVKEALSEYMVLRDSVIARYGDSSGGRLFIHCSNAHGRSMSDNCIVTAFERLSNKCGFTITATSLRRLYADTLFRTGVDENTIQRLMRHQEFKTTSTMYLSVDPVLTEQANNFVDDFFC